MEVGWTLAWVPARREDPGSSPHLPSHLGARGAHSVRHAQSKEKGEKETGSTKGNFLPPGRVGWVLVLAYYDCMRELAKLWELQSEVARFWAVVGERWLWFRL